MSKPTPGPWTITHDKKHGQQRISANDAPIAVTKVEANARLIAAAPDLLKACKALVEAGGNPTSLKLGSEKLQRFVSAWGDMRAAIVKAEGVS